jgi:hypothetical protein
MKGESNPSRRAESSGIYDDAAVKQFGTLGEEIRLMSHFGDHICCPVPRIKSIQFARKCPQEAWNMTGHMRCRGLDIRNSLPVYLSITPGFFAGLYGKIYGLNKMRLLPPCHVDSRKVALCNFREPVQERILNFSRTNIILGGVRWFMSLCRLLEWQKRCRCVGLDGMWASTEIISRFRGYHFIYYQFFRIAQTKFIVHGHHNLPDESLMYLMFCRSG